MSKKLSLRILLATPERTPWAKADDKRALLREMQRTTGDAPLLGMASRPTRQKWGALVRAALPARLVRPMQRVALGQVSQPRPQTP